MGLHNNIILTDGLELDDYKTILLKRGDVVSIEKYMELNQKFDEYLTLCALSATGDIKAKKYLEDDSVNNFSELVDTRAKDLIVKKVKSILDNLYPNTENINKESTNEFISH